MKSFLSFGGWGNNTKRLLQFYSPTTIANANNFKFKNSFYTTSAASNSNSTSNSTNNNPPNFIPTSSSSTLIDIQPINHQQQLQAHQTTTTNTTINKQTLNLKNQKEFISLLANTTKTLLPKYISTSQFIVEKTLDPLLIKTFKPETPIKAKNKYIIVGLGNPGEEYANTRHNIGFLAIDHLCKLFDCTLDTDVKSSMYTTLYLKLDEKLSSSQKKSNRIEKKQFHKQQVAQLENEFKNKLMENQQQPEQKQPQQSIVEQIIEEEEEESIKDKIKKPKQVVNQVIFLKPMTYMNLSGSPIRAIQSKYNVPIENILVFVDDVTNEIGSLKMRCKGGSAGQKGIESVIARLGTEKFPRIKLGVGIPRQGEILSNFVLKKISREKDTILNETLDQAARFSIMWLEKGSEFTMNQANKN